MDEVSRGLIWLKVCRTISINLLGQCLVTVFHIIRREKCVFMRNLFPRPMLVTGIDVATTFDILLHINQIELNHTRDVTINLIRCRTVF